MNTTYVNIFVSENQVYTENKILGDHKSCTFFFGYNIGHVLWARLLYLSFKKIYFCSVIYFCYNFCNKEIFKESFK